MTSNQWNNKITFPIQFTKFRSICITLNNPNGTVTDGTYIADTGIKYSDNFGFCGGGPTVGNCFTWFAIGF